MPTQLRAWGCDDELWDALRSKGRKDLKNLARAGDEELARARIAKLRETAAAAAMELEEEARRAADYLCAAEEECVVELTAQLIAEAKAEDATRVAAEGRLVDALELELGVTGADVSKAEAAATKATAEVGLDAAASDALPLAEAPSTAPAPSGFEWVRPSEPVSSSRRPGVYPVRRGLPTKRHAIVIRRTQSRRTVVRPIQYCLDPHATGKRLGRSRKSGCSRQFSTVNSGGGGPHRHLKSSNALLLVAAGTTGRQYRPQQLGGRGSCLQHHAILTHDHLRHTAARLTAARRTAADDAGTEQLRARRADGGGRAVVAASGAQQHDGARPIPHRSTRAAANPGARPVVVCCRRRAIALASRVAVRAAAAHAHRQRTRPAARLSNEPSLHSILERMRRVGGRSSPNSNTEGLCRRSCCSPLSSRVCATQQAIHKASHNLARLSSEIYLGLDSDLAAEERSRYATFGYPSFVRHLVALPISLKQRLRGVVDAGELWGVLLRSEADALLASPSPHLVVLASLSLLVLPLKNRDDGSGKGLALWGALEQSIGELQSAACQLDLVARLPHVTRAMDRQRCAAAVRVGRAAFSPSPLDPLACDRPPASYCVHTARFLALWTATLPLVLIDLFHCAAVPLVTLLVAWWRPEVESTRACAAAAAAACTLLLLDATVLTSWDWPSLHVAHRALYSTEELAKLLDEPFGRPGARSTPETVPVEMYCELVRPRDPTPHCRGMRSEGARVRGSLWQIVSELRQQALITRRLRRRVDEGAWVVTRDDLEQAPYLSEPRPTPTADVIYDDEGEQDE